MLNTPSPWPSFTHDLIRKTADAASASLLGKADAVNLLGSRKAFTQPAGEE
jgi:hypothetical protein